jgi:CDP-glucose 4,6-dehydratase
VVALRRDFDPESRFRTEGVEERCALALADLTDHDALVRVLNEHEVDEVYHLAAQTIVGTANRSPLATWDANVRGTYSLLEACRSLGTVRRVVVASSDKAYGDHDELPYREDFALQPRYPYDVSKACTDLIARSYANTYDLPVAVTRLANLYGPGDLNWSRIIPDSARALARGERPVIRSDGSLVRDYFYVEDGVSAYLLLAERLSADPALRGEAFNFSNERRTDVMELTRRILATMQSDLQPLVLNEAHHEIPFQALSAAKARERLGWKPSFELDEALGRTVTWYREFFDGR